MKTSTFILTPIILTLIVISCAKDDLNQNALGQLDEEKLANKKGVESLLIGAYALLDGVSGDNFGTTGFWGSAASNWIYGSICGSEAYKGSAEGDQFDITLIERFSSLPTNNYFDAKWSTVYAGVQRSNSVLRVMRKAKDMNPDDTTRIRAEALFLRAHYHFEATKMWGKVPFVSEFITYDANNYRLANDIIWDEIENDLKYAIQNLPEVQLQAPGRPNRSAAKAYLAKAHMFQEEFAEARLLLTDLIQTGVTSSGAKYKLNTKFADNFNPATKNSDESVFAVQMSVNDGAVVLTPTTDIAGNGNFGDILNFPFGADAPGGCCGFFQPSQFLVNHFKTDAISGLPDLDSFNTKDVKNDQGVASSDTFTIYSGPLDPRLDWTVGRRGIPYLDWGSHPGADWIRFDQYHGPYSPIKNIYYKADREIYTDPGYWTSGLTANNVNLIRFADVLLWAAEAEIESGNLEQARIYVNRVRERAANQDGWVKNNLGPYAPYASRYKIGMYQNIWTDVEFARKAVRYERILELAMEGHRFFDLVRWGIAEQEINSYLKKEMQKRIHLKDATFQSFNEYFPIPQRQIDLSTGADGIPKMKQNPGY